MKTEELEALRQAHGADICARSEGNNLIRRRCGISERAAVHLRDYLRKHGPPREVDRLPRGIGGPAIEYPLAPVEPDTVELTARPVESRYRHERVVDGYLFWMPGRPTPLHMPPARVQAITRAYSNWSGSPATVNEIAREHGLTRPEAYGVIKALGLTHDSEPFTAEEMADRSIEDLADEAAGMKRQALYRQVQRKAWADIRRDALRWRTLEESALLPIGEAAERIAPTYQPPRLAMPEAPRRWMLVYSPTDLHYGKLGWTGYGSAYSRDECRRRLEAASARLFADLPGRPESVLCPIGSDWFHIDNRQGHTTRGTPQDMDGVPEQIWEEGVALAIDALEVARQVAPLRIVLQAGNHDSMLSRALMSVIRAWYRDADDVTIEGDAGPYQVVTYGASVIGVTHGDGRHKARDLGPLMAHHHPQQWGAALHRYWLTGNLHHHTIEEGAGVTVLQLPSLAGSDRWHIDKGYSTSRPALHGVGIDYERGLFLQRIEGIAQTSTEG